MEPGAVVVLLDAGGKQFTSQQFARWMGDLRDRGIREIAFLCGDASGFPAALRDAAKQKISLSTLTMPHEFARVVLAEQIYRGFAILCRPPVSEIGRDRSPERQGIAGVARHMDRVPCLAFPSFVA